MHDHLSRALYRRLARVLDQDYGIRDPDRTRQILLHACETTVARLADDREYFAAPERFLFSSIRALYPIGAQLRVRRIIDRDVAAASALLEGLTAGVRRDCAATTRYGTPCLREPLDGHRYCPSHRHLEVELQVA
jgi:hypothetical protein